MGNIIHELLFVPTFNILMLLYTYLGQNLGIAIIALAVITRLITYPMTRNQLKGAAKSKDFQAQYKKIKEKYSKNPQKQAEELGRLQMKYLPGQLSGCLPLILQVVFLIQVRNVLVALIKNNGLDSFYKEAYPFVSSVVKNAGITDIHLGFLGVDLGKVATDIGITNFPEVIPYLLLAIFVGVTQLVSTKILSALNMPPKADETKQEVKSKKSNKKDEKKATQPDMEEMMKMMNVQMMYMFPIMTLLMSLGYLGGSSFLPAGVSLFWTMQSLFVIIQNVYMKRDLLIKKVQLLINKPNEKRKNSH